jgi:hypothetical protein
LEANPCEGFGNDFNPNVPFPAGIPAWSRVTCNLRKDGLTHLKRTHIKNTNVLAAHGLSVAKFTPEMEIFA